MSKSLVFYAGVLHMMADSDTDIKVNEIPPGSYARSATSGTWYHFDDWGAPEILEIDEVPKELRAMALILT